MFTHQCVPIGSSCVNNADIEGGLFALESSRFLHLFNRTIVACVMRLVVRWGGDGDCNKSGAVMKVLVVEDYEALRSSLKKGLEENGYAVDVADNGEDGLWLAQNESYDVAILDLMLPKVHGLDILRQIRAQGFAYPVLILTVQGSVSDRVQGLDLGADDYLVKPFAFEELLARVRALVRRRYQERNPVIELKGIRIDTVGQQVFVQDGEVALTGREYALLELLARRAGEVVSRTEIWEHLYALDSDRISNVVDVYIAALRRKLAQAGSENLITTLRGRGYRLEANV